VKGRLSPRATTIQHRNARLILSKDLLVSKTPGAYLLKQQQEMTAVKIVTERRRVLGTFAVTMADTFHARQSVGVD
jgi:hypothetical protein